MVQWGGADVWKIGGKVFALAGGSDDDPSGPRVTVKASDISWEIYREAAGVRPAPYLASRGMKWLQRTSDETWSDDDLHSLIEDSYRLVVGGLTRKMQKELGLT